MTLELIILDGSDRRFPLVEGGEVTVGASSRCAIRLDAPDVSRSHALLTVRKGQLVVLDLGSTNGTFVNGRPIKEQTLEVGDCVRFSSVLAQIVPAGEHSSSPGTRVISQGAAVSSSGAHPVAVSASQPMAVILQESLLGLLRSWSMSEASALNALAEWVVSHRGHRGLVLVEPAADDLVVLAAHGDIQDVLQRPGQLRLLRDQEAHAASAVESLTLEVTAGRLVAIRAPGTPWMVLRVGIGMPDTLETELYARLMAIARRLDEKVPERIEACRH